MSGYPQHNAPGYGYGPPPSQQPYLPPSTAAHNHPRPTALRILWSPSSGSWPTVLRSTPIGTLRRQQAPQGQTLRRRLPSSGAALRKPIRISDAIGLPTRLGSERGDLLPDGGSGWKWLHR
ncbi:hypothetical protein LOK49_LG12G02709 [Camellia lanceoleosa]|uniref:Uncharacterized protein n=1 Tax=Camellia lanceoleosa TaxID=1840588 RepID=A0ACC0FTM6_9ERIC|nr:hypothetical protein LOK49_LG12G02709 [Camellia lanceoleosa]